VLEQYERISIIWLAIIPIYVFIKFIGICMNLISVQIIKYFNESLLALYIFLRSIHTIKEDPKFLPILLIDIFLNLLMSLIDIKIN